MFVFLIISKPLNKVTDIVILYFYFIKYPFIYYLCLDAKMSSGTMTVFFQSDDISIVTVILIHCRHIWFSRGSYQVIMTKTSINALNDKKRMVHQLLNADICSAKIKWFVLRFNFIIFDSSLLGSTLMTASIHMISKMIDWL